MDEQDQAEPAGPFSWKQEIPATEERWIAGETFTLFLGSHSGYARLPRPAYHRRWVVALKPGIFLVRDLVEGEGEHRVDLSWHLESELQLQQEQLFRFEDSSCGVCVLPAQDHVWSEDIQQGLWSPSYGAERRTTVLKFGRTCRLPAEFATLFLPLPEAAAIPGKFLSFRPEGKTDDMVRAYRYETNESDHRFFFSRSGAPWSCGPVKSDAEFVCVTTRNLSQAADLILCNGSYLELEGNRVLSAVHCIARWERLSGQTPQVFCSDPGAVQSSRSNSERIVNADETV